MLRAARGLRKNKEAAVLLRNAILLNDGCTSIASNPISSRHYAELPQDYQQHYAGVKSAERRKIIWPTKSAESLTASNSVNIDVDPSTEGSEGISPALQRQSAASVTAWMFPWEKRQMDGQAGPLKSWERFYWGVFVSAIAFLLYSRLSGRDKDETPDPEELERKQRQKKNAARLLMAGQPLSAEDEELFEGSTPKEIQDYIDRTFGADRSSDPFEGLSPEEINEILSTSSQTQGMLGSAVQ